jgi:hypothetical protein
MAALSLRNETPPQLMVAFSLDGRAAYFLLTGSQLLWAAVRLVYTLTLISDCDGTKLAAKSPSISTSPPGDSLTRSFSRL